jgi:pyridoxal phosphate enzyme (YggS family)
MGIKENLRNILPELPHGVRLVAVSKNHGVDEILQAYQAGHRVFGENKAQEIAAKQPLLPGDIEWHFVGHLQTNKVRYIASFVRLIHSIDSLKLLAEVNRQAQKNHRIIDCLLQFHIATEETKFGLNLQEATGLLRSYQELGLPHVRITGVMGMASLSEDGEMVRKEFRQLREHFLCLKRDFFGDSEDFREISMGMSGDYRIALEEGSTLVRIGTLVFGEGELT